MGKYPNICANMGNIIVTQSLLLWPKANITHGKRLITPPWGAQICINIVQICAKLLWHIPELTHQTSVKIKGWWAFGSRILGKLNKQIIIRATNPAWLGTYDEYQARPILSKLRNIEAVLVMVSPQKQCLGTWWDTFDGQRVDPILGKLAKIAGIIGNRQSQPCKS